MNYYALLSILLTSSLPAMLPQLTIYDYTHILATPEVSTFSFVIIEPPQFSITTPVAPMITAAQLKMPKSSD